MSKLLIAEPPLQVLPTLAKALGLAPAIVLQQLHYHSLRSREDGWVQKSLTDWQDEDFSFMSLRSVERAFGILRERGVIETRIVPSDSGRESMVRVDHDALERLTDGSRQSGGTPFRQVGGTRPANLAGSPTNKGKEKQENPPSPPEGGAAQASRSLGPRPKRPSGRRTREFDAYLTQLAAWAPHVDALDETLKAGWELIRMQLREGIGEQQFDTWIEPLHPHGDDQGLLVLAGPQVIVGMVEDRFIPVLEQMTGRTVEIVPCNRGIDLRAAA